MREEIIVIRPHRAFERTGEMDVRKMGNEEQSKVTDNWDNKPVGTEERQSLKAADVLVKSYEKVEVTTKKGKSDKVVLNCKHPDKEETIGLSEVRRVNGDKIEIVALWLNLDNKNEIRKDSGIASLLRFYGVATVKELVGKTVKTEIGPSGYLCIKAF